MLVLIILCLSVASNILFAQNKFNNAVADITSITHVDEILIRGYENESANSKRVFEKKNITKLFEKLSGITNAKASDLRGLLKNSDQINNGSSTKLTITINGKPWYAMYLSSNRNGDPILTLWLADASLSSQWSYFGDNADGDYPANMYGTSMIRAVGLNNGGKYATNFDSLSNETSQNSSNVFAIYTMEDISGSLTSFIDTPSNVAWQETVSARDNNFSASGTNYSYNFNNDAYSTTMVNFYDSAHDYQSKTGYTNWSSDKIWLPSMAETGWSQKNGGNYRGLWKTDVSQRLSGGSSTFLRSVSIQNYNEICLLNYEGK